MNFTVTYRGRDGKIRELQLEAADRAAVFKELEQRGIAAIKVAESVRQPGRAGKPSRASAAAFRGGVAGAVVVVGAVAAWLLWPHRAKVDEPTPEKKNDMIAETKPAAAAPVAGEEIRQPATTKPMPPQRPHEVRDGMLMLSNGRLLPTNKLRRVSVEDRKPRFRYAIFEHSTDNELAAILTLKPGQALIGGPIRHRDYKADFLKSLETPVVVRKDDPEDVQEVKRAVISARKLIMDAIDGGEDPAEVIKNAYEEARKLALYKDDIRREVMNMAKDGDYTDAEVDALIAAANRMLEAKGIAPMHLGPIMKARLRTLKR